MRALGRSTNIGRGLAKIEGAAGTIVEKSSLSPTELEETLAAFMSWGRQSDAAMWCPAHSP